MHRRARAKQRARRPAPRQPAKNVQPRKPRSATPRVRGRGGYTSALTSLGAGLGSIFGPVGGVIGGAAGDLLGTIIGRGAYKLNRNSLTMGDHGPPIFGDGSIRVKHREFITDVASTTGFGKTSWHINPADPVTFPWLSRIAQSFQNFEFMGLVFEFKTTSATAVASTNTALGTVVLATNYDPNAPPFANKQQMEAYEFSNSTSPSISAMHPVECAPSNMPVDMLYINPPGSNNGDARFSNLGVFTLATAGMQAASNIGELWVSYDVRLTKPALAPLLGQFSDAAFIWTNSGTSTLPVANHLQSQFGSCQANANSGNTIMIPQTGLYQIVAWYVNNGGAAFTGVPGLSLGPNLAFISLSEWGAGNTTDEGNWFDSSGAMTVSYVECLTDGTGGGNLVSLVGPTSATVTHTNVWVLPVPPPYATTGEVNTPPTASVDLSSASNYARSVQDRLAARDILAAQTSAASAYPLSNSADTSELDEGYVMPPHAISAFRQIRGASTGKDEAKTPFAMFRRV